VVVLLALGGLVMVGAFLGVVDTAVVLAAVGVLLGVPVVLGSAQRDMLEAREAARKEGMRRRVDAVTVALQAGEVAGPDAASRLEFARWLADGQRSRKRVLEFPGLEHFVRTYAPPWAPQDNDPENRELQ
jgi:hypothetical protein